MDSPSPIKSARRDGQPLAQLSPQRVNGRVARSNNNMTTTSPYSLSSPIRKKQDNDMAHTFFSPQQLPGSPSLPEFSVVRERLAAYTDVSGLVKRFEHLDVRDRDAESLERKRKYDEALERAKIAQDDAEAESAKCREELRAQKKDFEECRHRERIACKRIDVLMDEFARAKEEWSSQSGVYEKEVRRARKEAFKSSSAVLKMQEENKHAVAELKAVKGKLDLAQRRTSQAEEEKFSAQYQLVAVQEELEKLQTTLRIAQEEREAIKRSLKEDELARIAAEGHIALPASTEEDPTIIAEPAARDLLPLKTAELERELQHERRRRRRAQDLAQFMKLECQYRCCSCAERGQSQARHSIRAARLSQGGVTQDQPMSDQQPSGEAAHSEVEHLASPEFEMQDEQPVLPEEAEMQPASPVLHKTQHMVPSARTPSPEREQTQCESSIRMVTKTMKVPMNFSPERTSTTVLTEAPTTPVERPQDTTAKAYPFDREAALAAIAYRRNRAKSFAESQATPKRSLMEAAGNRRDISAPVVSG